jgi:hypothetical protein
MKIPKWLKDEDGDDKAEEPKPKADDEELSEEDKLPGDERDPTTYPLW